MKNFVFFIFILFTSLSLNVFAKGKVIIDKETKIRPATAIKLGDRLYAESYYYNAADMYKQALMVKGDNRYAMYWLAKSYYMSRDYEKAVAWYQKFTQTKAKKDNQIKKFEKQNSKYFSQFNYDYGVSLQMNGMYDEAIEKFTSFIKSYEGDDKASMEKLAKAHIEGCNFAKEHPEVKKVRVTEMNKMVNNAYTESAPFPVGENELYFTSLPQNKLIQINNWKRVKKAKLFKTTRVDGQWTTPVALPENINTSGFEIGNCAITPDGKRMYFTKCHHPMEDEVICELYVSENTGGKWGEPKLLPEPVNSQNYTTTQPTVRPMDNGGEMVYFISDRPGGVGDMDIWFFIRDAKGNIKGPNNVKSLNTVGNEFTPSWDDTKKVLYYSSDGLPGFGGFDVYKTVPAENLDWSKPENLLRPINSQFDDIYYTKVSNSTSGYLVSNRKGTTVLNSETASDDIFHFEDFKYGLEGTISRDGGDGAPMEGAIVKLFSKDINGTDSLVAIDSTISGDGAYFFKLAPDADYKVVAYRNGFMPKEELVSTANLPMEDTINQDFKIKQGIILTSGNVLKEGDATNTPLANATITIQEKDPQTGKYSTIKTITTTAENPLFNVDLDKEKKYKVNIRKDGFFAKTYDINPRDFGDVTTARKDLTITEMEKDKAYTLSNIYYEFAKADLTITSQSVLDELKKLLDENPTIVIELSAHTDNNGTDERNMALSQRRAESCVNYLISKGVARERLVPKGYGESKPVVSNSKPDGSDDPDGRAKNRRTEFKILGELKDNVKVGYEEKDNVKK
jgi:outer membrane protein OmpA-like peptidoglycan-associated protein